MLFVLKTLIQWRRFILVCALVGAALMAGVSFLLPSWYSATTSIFPPEPTVMPAYAELVQQLSAPLLGPVATGATPETIYIEMLKSRSIDEKIIEEFNLMHVYGTKRMEACLDALVSHMSFSLLDNGLLIFKFEDRDPERAAAIANRLVELLDQTVRGLKVSRAGRTRDFIERQLAECEGTLAQAEDSLRDFQKAHDTVDLDEQLRSAMDIVTTLSARAISLETEMGIMSHWAGTNSEEYQRKKTEHEEVVSQLKKLKSSPEGSDRDLVRSFLPTLRDVPDVALQYVRLKRNVTVQNTVYTTLVGEFEKARIEEARDTPVVQVLDHARKPGLRSRPKRKLLVIVGGLIGLGWSALIAVFATVWREDRERSAAVRDLIGPLASDLKRLSGRARSRS
jgi:uncharacterized protein involved in exopolysaccharide biosynthesis